MQYEFYYSELAPEERRIYRKICNSLKRYERVISIGKVGQEQLQRIVRALEYDHPELYYWDYREITTNTIGSRMTIRVNYFWTNSEIVANEPRLERGIKEILDKCKGRSTSEYDRFLSIYSCMGRNIQYDYAHADSDYIVDIAYAHTILGVFAKHHAVCDGISKAFKLVLERAGIDCIVVYGKKVDEHQKNQTHAWNIVWIDNKPCHVDLTWAVENSTSESVNHDYVGLTDSQIKKDHVLNNILDTPECNSEEFDYYVRNNAVMRSVRDLQNYLQNKANAKPFEIIVRLDFECDIKDVAKKASDYVVRHYVVTGDCVDIKVDAQYRKGQNILIMTGR